jgi:catechol 2,3-dioxygenase-like lactoylglutathione lyase family enzyme
MMDMGEPSAGTRIVPWLYCADLTRSLAFYLDVLGFSLLGAQTEYCSAYVEHEGAPIMLQEAREGALIEGPLEYPFGRGVYLLLQTNDVDSLHTRLRTKAGDDSVLVAPRNRYYRIGGDMIGHREIVVKDPDGYILRFYHAIEGLEEA